MKAAIQNTLLYLLCLASVVLAAPHQSVLTVRQMRTEKTCCKLKGDKVMTPGTCNKVSGVNLLDISARFGAY